MARKGRALELLVATIEHSLTDEGSRTVESPGHLVDRTNNRKREHDVLINMIAGHHKYFTAIECRDRKQKVDSGHVEAFVMKCMDTGVNQGIMVSSTGYTKPALQKASFHNILCFNLTEAEKFNWLFATGVRSRIKKLVHSDWKFFPKIEGIVEQGNIDVVNDSGEIIPVDNFISFARDQLNKLPLEEDGFSVGTKEMKMLVSGEGLHLRNKNNGDTVPVKHGVAILSYEVNEKLIPFEKLSRYSDGDGVISDVAVSNIDIAGKTFSLMIIYNEENGGKVVLVPKGIQ